LVLPAAAGLKATTAVINVLVEVIVKQ